MAFLEFEGEAKDSEHQRVNIGTINCAPPFSHQHVDLTLEMAVFMLETLKSSRDDFIV